MSDVTIPRETARAIAALLRGAYDDQPAGEAARYADLLDPRPSLRDAVAQAIRNQYRSALTWDVAADAVLAVVRDHIAALTYFHDEHANACLYRRDLLALFDGADS